MQNRSPVSIQCPSENRLRLTTRFTSKVHHYDVFDSLVKSKIDNPIFVHNDVKAITRFLFTSDPEAPSSSSAAATVTHRVEVRSEDERKLGAVPFQVI